MAKRPADRRATKSKTSSGATLEDPVEGELEPTRAIGVEKRAGRDGGADAGADGGAEIRTKRGSKPEPSSRGATKSKTKAKKKVRRRRIPFLPRLRWIVTVGLLLAVVGVFGLAYLLSKVELPPDVDAPPQTSFIYDSAGGELAQLHAGENRVIVTLDQVSEPFKNAVIATEDRNFFSHKGVDIRGAARAAWAALRSREIKQGGSTITQQYVKLVYTGGERTFARKLKEAALAVKLERRHSKDEIFSLYINRIYFGRGAYGAQAAARAYFGKDASQITAPEAALLAGLIRAPEVADPLKAPDVAKARRNSSLEAMAEMGFITEGDYQAWSRLDFERCDPTQAPAKVPAEGKMCVAPQPKAQLSGAGSAAYFVDYVRQYLIGKYTAERVFKGGLKVYTTLDPALQSYAREAIDSVLDREGDPEAAIVTLDSNGRIVAMIGGRDFSTSEVNLAVGSAGGGSGRQPGSAFKPITLATAVDKGISLKSRYPGPASITLRLPGGGTWTVKNYGGSSYGTEDLVVATANSINTIYAQLQMEVGADATVEMAKRLGINSELQATPAIVLGSEEVSPLDMATAYLVFANRGMAAGSRAIDKVVDADGVVLEEAPNSKQRVLEENKADQINFALQAVITRGTGKGAAIGRPAAGKTGTTEDYGDAWFVGYTPEQYSTAVWMGYPEGRQHKMTNVHGRSVAGGSFPATIWSRYMKRVVEGKKATSFVTPKLTGRVLGATSDPCTDPDSSPVSEVDKPACPSPTPMPSPSAAASGASPTPSPSPRRSPSPSPSTTPSPAPT
jgi:penicillin-binding protein 1A